MLARAIDRQRESLGPLAALTCQQLSGPLTRFEGSVQEVHFSSTSASDQHALWSAALSAEEKAAHPGLVESLTECLDAPAGAICQAVTRARRSSANAGELIGLNAILQAHGEHSAQLASPKFHHPSRQDRRQVYLPCLHGGVLQQTVWNHL